MPQTKQTIPFINRELSWLDFNERVLQEAEDVSVPLIERVRFLGIFSNNLDEFFRVRVATTKRLTKLNAKEKKALPDDPQQLLQSITNRAIELQQRFEKSYQKILKELKKENILIINNEELLDEHKEYVKEYFDDEVRPMLVPIMLGKNNFPKLSGKSIYFAVKLIISKKETTYAIIEVPSEVISRFLVLPQVNNKKYVMLLDDVIRCHLEDIFSIFNYNRIEAYTIKVTLDAELDIDEDISQSVVDKLSKSLKNRQTAQPVRLVYDKDIPSDLLKHILSEIKSSEGDSIIPGGRYHNFKDFINFPKIGVKRLRFNNLPPLEHPLLQDKTSVFEEIGKQDILLNYPYQSFHHVIDLLREAAMDPDVTSIKINLYRVAKKSKVINALINAAKNGKKVTVIVELRARFDEEANIYWSNKLQDEGVKVIFGIPGLKVHSKLILINRKENGRTVKYAHVGTGNFHEGTATIYGDTSLLTKDPRITNEVNKVLRLFKNTYERPLFKHLIVSPFNVRRRFNLLINNEIKNAKAGKEAYIIIKLNNLYDEQMIKKLYQASKAGVKIKLIIRGICSLVPGIKGVSENIEVISIVDRFLEHARILVFCNGGEEKYFLTSADWMTRNLDRRIEVGCPIYNKKLQKQLQDMLDIQMADNVKARLVNSGGKNNKYKVSGKGKHRSQIDLYKYFEKQVD